MSAKRDTEKKCEALLRLIVELANTKGHVTLEEDFGGNTLTIIVNEMGHTHVGSPGGSFEDLVDGLYNSLSGGPGLSWCK